MGSKEKKSLYYVHFELTALFRPKGAYNQLFMLLAEMAKTPPTLIKYEFFEMYLTDRYHPKVNNFV